MNCVICGRSAGAKAKTYELTEEERHIVSTLLQSSDKPDPVYCSMCDRIMHDPEQASQLMRGLFLTSLRKAGVPLPVAERSAQRVYEFYLKKALAKT